MIISQYRQHRSSWKFLEMFAFVPQGSPFWASKTGVGRAEFTVYHNYQNDSLWVLGFSYKSVKDYQRELVNEPASSFNCQQRIAAAPIRFQVRVSESTPFVSLPNGASGPRFLYQNSFSTTITADQLGTGSPQMVYWFLANCLPASQCPYPQNNTCNGYLNLYIKAHWYFTPDYFALPTSAGELSFEQYRNDKLAIWFFVLQTVLVGLSIYTAKLLHARLRLHSSALLLFFCIGLYWFRCLFLLIYFGQYANRGQVVQGLLSTSQTFAFLGEAALISFLCCVGGGWTIFRRKLKLVGRVRVVFFSVAYSLISLAAVIWFATEISSGGGLFVYSTPPGILAMCLLTAAYGRFHLVMRRTLAVHCPSAGNDKFFKCLWALGALFILTRPLLAVICLAVPELYQDKTFLPVDITVAQFVQLVLITLYNPRVCGRLFPFHAAAQDFQSFKTRKAAAVVSVAGDGPGAAEDAARGAEGRCVRVTSFTGGSSVGLLHRSASGRYQLPSDFDRQQLIRLKESSDEISAMADTLKQYVALLEGNFQSIDFSETSGQAAERDRGDRAALLATTTTGRAAAADRNDSGSQGQGKFLEWVGVTDRPPSPKPIPSSSSSSSSFIPWRGLGLGSRPPGGQAKDEDEENIFDQSVSGGHLRAAPGPGPGPGPGSEP